jgi:hypothetical protein
MGMIDGPNLYAYVGNNPINFVDPWGLFADSFGGDFTVSSQGISNLVIDKIAVREAVQVGVMQESIPVVTQEDIQKLGQPVNGSEQINPSGGYKVKPKDKSSVIGDDANSPAVYYKGGESKIKKICMALLCFFHFSQDPEDPNSRPVWKPSATAYEQQYREFKPEEEPGPYKFPKKE